MFFAEPDEVGGISDAIAGIEPEPPAPEPAPEPEPAAPVEAPPVAPTAPVIDYDAMAKSLGGVIKEHFPQPAAAPAAPKMSQEEIDKLMKKWEPDDAFLTRFDNIETRKEAMKEFMQRSLEQAEVRAQLQAFEVQQRIQQEYAPRLSAFDEWQAQQREARFSTAYPDLAAPGLRPVLLSVATELAKTQKFADEKSAFDAIAKGVERVIQSHTPTFKLSGKKTVSNPNELPTVSAGAGAGGAAKGNDDAKPKGPRGVELFRPVGR